MIQKEGFSPFKLIRFGYLSLFCGIITFVLKFFAYFLTSSISLLSDALETIINLVSSVILVTSLSISFRPPDKDHTYGHGKVEYIATAVEGIFILIAFFSIVMASYKRFMGKVVLSNISFGLYMALTSALLNLGVGITLIKASKVYDSVLLEADGRHLLTDVWTTVGVLVGLLVMSFCPAKLWFLDPLFAVLIGFHIAYTGIKLLKRAYGGLMDISLPEGEIKLIGSIISKIGGSRVRFHCLKTRKSGRYRFIEFHLVVPGYTTVKDSHDLCCLIEEEIKKKLPNSKVVIHIEPVEDEDTWDGDREGGISDEELKKVKNNKL